MAAVPRPSITAHSASDAMPDDRQRKANLRLALILATVSLALGLGFVARLAWFGP